MKSITTGASHFRQLEVTGSQLDAGNGLRVDSALTGSDPVLNAVGDDTNVHVRWLPKGAGGAGYATGSGGTITQATSKATGVTLNKACGAITLNAASLAATTNVGFTLTNSVIAATDVVLVNIKSGATADSYAVTVDAVAAGSCRISLRNVTAGALAEAVVLNFVVIKAVAA